MSTLPDLPDAINFPYEKLSLRRLKAITDYRQCQDGFPVESRILFLARGEDEADDEASVILKVKIQIPHEGRNSVSPAAGPSDLSKQELHALKTFRDTDSQHAPYLLASKTVIQGPKHPMTGGYITYTAMSRMPGQNLLDLKFWSMTIEERLEIQGKFLDALGAVRAVGIEPGDKGLRNVMWHKETKHCSLVDFELWSPFDGFAGDTEKDLQAWGLAQRPPSKNWWAEFGIHTA